MTEGFVGRLLGKLEKTEVVERPFPHLVIQSVFDEQTYEKIQRSFFKPKEMEPLSEDHPDRFVIHLSKVKNWDKDGDQRKSFWKGLTDSLADVTVSTALFRKFENYAMLNPKFRELSRGNNQSLNLLPRTVLSRDMETYSLGPHKDIWDKLLTVLFYLPASSGLGHSGTSLFSPKDPKRQFEHHAHYKFSLFDELTEIPFEPNSLMMFLKTDSSYHGVKATAASPPPRDLIMHNVYLVDDQEKPIVESR